MTTRKATFGAGCFWGVEEAFRNVEGVVDAAVGYSGGRTEAPTYQDVCTDRTGHAEVVQVDYDPARVSYDRLLDVFWSIHDPTTLNRQGADAGTQYRSAIFVHDEAQRAAAEQSKAAVQEHWRDPVVTEITPLDRFWPAEEYHQDYFARNPQSGYCQAVINPKLAKLREKHAARLRAGA
jgi:peptide-methionine (S)-S-oxide reductase